jgi:hypothetical protein
LFSTIIMVAGLKAYIEFDLHASESGIDTSDHAFLAGVDAYFAGQDISLAQGKTHKYKVASGLVAVMKESRTQIGRVKRLTHDWKFLIGNGQPHVDALAAIYEGEGFTIEGRAPARQPGHADWRDEPANTRGAW